MTDHLLQGPIGSLHKNHAQTASHLSIQSSPNNAHLIYLLDSKTVIKSIWTRQQLHDGFVTKTRFDRIITQCGITNLRLIKYFLGKQISNLGSFKCYISSPAHCPRKVNTKQYGCWMSKIMNIWKISHFTTEAANFGRSYHVTSSKFSKKDKAQNVIKFKPPSLSSQFNGCFL